VIYVPVLCRNFELTTAHLSQRDSNEASTSAKVCLSSILNVFSTRDPPFSQDARKYFPVAYFLI